MTGKQRSGVFLSYARTDGEAFAATLRERLRQEAPDIVVKQDRLLLEGGVGWWKQLAEAIDSVEFLILIMTPSAMQSETVRKEWRYARQAGVCVYPIKAAPDSELDFSKLPRWMNKAHFFDVEKEWATFIGHLRKGCDAPRVPFMPPDLPDSFIERPSEFGSLKNLLLSPDRKEPVAITTALSGAGGFGKTTLATALCHDEDVIQSFDDGIIWVTLGQTPNVLNGLITVYAALTGERPGFASEDDAAFQLGQKLEDRTCLLVVDDVWDESHLRPFLRGGKGCARLFTTRNSEIASNARPINVDEMRESESLALLTKGVPGLSTALASQLSQRLGEWPIALELARAMMRQRIEQGDSAEHAAQRQLQLLDKKGLRGLAKGTGDPRHRTIDAVLQGSLELLSPEDRTRLIELSIFPEDVSIPLSAAASLWRLDEFESEETAQRFARLYLLKLDLGHASMRLHDVMRSWLVTATTNTTELHNRLLNAWPDRMRLPDNYAWRWLIWHLAQAKRRKDIESILWNPAWVQAKLRGTDVNALISDFEHMETARETELVQGALRLSSHILARDPSQFASQMVGRLSPLDQHADIRRFTATLITAANRPWLRPLRPSLEPPGTALLRTLVGHSSGVSRVALSKDGRRAVSTFENTLKVWNVDTGQLRTLAGHSSEVTDVALSLDGRRAVSVSADANIKVWDIDSGHELRTLSHHPGRVRRVALSADGHRAVSTLDNTIKVWDIENGSILHTLAHRSSWIHDVALSPDGRRAVSVSTDGTFMVWDVESGQRLGTLDAHSGWIRGLALSTDGRRAVSTFDTTVKVWDTDTGRELRTLPASSGTVHGVALSPDGRRAVSASADNTLRLWHTETGQRLGIFTGHSDWVRSVALSADGRRALSASDDNTLKVWDIEAGPERRTVAHHSGPVIGIAVCPDGLHAISASADKTMKVWDIKTGRELRSLAGHFDTVIGMALSPDGRTVFASDNEYSNTIKAWDLKGGHLLFSLRGHSGQIHSIALTPDGRYAFSASADRTIKMWDLKTSRDLQTFWGHLNWVRCVVLSRDGRWVVSASADNTLKVWDLKKGGVPRTLSGHSGAVMSVALSPNGRHAISASADNTLKVWDIQTDHALRTLSGHSGAVMSVAMSPDGRHAVSASVDNTLKVWDIETGAGLASFTCDAIANCCAFADDRTIIAGDHAGQIHYLALELP